MAKAERIGRFLHLYCPGCKGMHAVSVDGTEGPRWQWNGDLASVTLSPSILLRSGHYASGHDPKKGCWCDFEARMGRKADFKCVVCHSFVKNGQWEFLSDSTHELAGQTVPLVDIPEDEL